MVARNVLGFSVAPNMSRMISCNGLYASIMRAEKKKNNDSGLPTGIPIPCMPVDLLKERPDFWVGGEGSYVCPVDTNWGLWFNWSMNNQTNNAILVSIKGMNPLDGRRINGLGLEQYVEQCPVHKQKFSHGKFCEKCGFVWPPQNYISKPCAFYLDGFRESDGKVRQFYFTDDMAKSVPELVIGKDDTVPAFGFCFFSLDDKQDYEDGNRLKDENTKQYFSKTQKTFNVGMGSTSPTGKLILDSACYSSMLCSADIHYEPRIMCYNAASSTEIKSSVDIVRSMSVKKAIRKSSEVGVGAGEQINQKLEVDKRWVKIWPEKPSAVFRIYFVFQEEFERYAKAGIKQLNKKSYLNKLPVGA